MKVRLNSISGIDDAIVTMYLSKRTYTAELEEEIRKTCDRVLTRRGFIREDAPAESLATLNHWLDLLCKIGVRHMTLLRYIDFSITVEGLHRAATDDLDSHAKRMENRIIRSSTRLSTYGYEMSDWYKGKIIPTDLALQGLGIQIPNEIFLGKDRWYGDDFTYGPGSATGLYNIYTIGTNYPWERDTVKYVKAVNGYIREDLKDDNDVKRGLYMECIPVTFEYKINLTEYSHVYKERGERGGAHQELKDNIEETTDQIEAAFHQFNRDLLMKIKN